MERVKTTSPRLHPSRLQRSTSAHVALSLNPHRAENVKAAAFVPFSGGTRCTSVLFSQGFVVESAAATSDAGVDHTAPFLAPLSGIAVVVPSLKTRGSGLMKVSCVPLGLLCLPSVAEFVCPSALRFFFVPSEHPVCPPVLGTRHAATGRRAFVHQRTRKPEHRHHCNFWSWKVIRCTGRRPDEVGHMTPEL